MSENQNKDQDRVADAIPSSWVDLTSPRVRPYLQLMRADRPIGWWLLFIPCIWSIALGTWVGGPLVNGGVASDVWPNLLLVALFWIGAVVMRGAGCTINDIFDRDIDAKVERTRSRPIPSGRVSTKAAIAFLGAQCLVGLVILLQLNEFSIVLGASSLILVGLYPLAKRVTNWPQLVLGLTINWGALLGFTAVTGALHPAAFLLYVAGLVWTLAYDTIYAHQDKADDAIIGIGSSALALGDKTKPFVTICFVLTLSLCAATTIWFDESWLFWFTLGCAGLHAFYQLTLLDIDDPEICLKLFRANREFGLLIAAAFLFGTALPLGLFS